MGMDDTHLEVAYFVLLGARSLEFPIGAPPSAADRYLPRAVSMAKSDLHVPDPDGLFEVFETRPHDPVKETRFVRLL
jgi:hypothetical protein